MKKYSYVPVLMMLFAFSVASQGVSTPLGRELPKPKTASDGGPIATCRPGANCKPNDQLRQLSAYSLQLGMGM